MRQNWVMVSQRWSKVTLVGDAVTLRPVDADDADAVWEMVSDEEGNDLTGTTEAFERAQIDAWCASRLDQDERLDLAIVENATGEFAGEVVLNEFDADANTASFRISLRGPNWYGRGLGSAATAIILRHGFDGIGLDAITLEVLERNPRARRVYTKQGFEETRRFAEGGENWVEMRIRRSDS